jgi:hypothetical protein
MALLTAPAAATIYPVAGKTCDHCQIEAVVA